MKKDMTQRTLSRTVAAASAALLIASMGLAGCDRRDEAVAVTDTPATVPTTTADGSVTSTPATSPQAVSSTTQDRSAELQAEASRAVERTKESAKEVGSDISAATRDAAATASSKVDDARITTLVNTELAKDSTLSALKINVDTANGRVALKGTAPTENARERATVLASAVSGVVSVDNQITVEPRKM